VPTSPVRFGDMQFFAFLDALPLGAYVFRLEDPAREESLRMVFANRASSTIVGIDSASLVGGLIGECFPDSLGESGRAAAYRRVILDQEHRDLGIISWGDDRTSRNRFAVSGYPIGSDALVILFEALNATPGRVTELAAIVESADDAILSKSLDGTILTWNASAERIYGYSAAEAIGRSISLLLPPDRPNEVTEILERLRAGERIEHLLTRRVRKDGTVIDVSLTVSPIRDARGEVVGAATIARDVGKQRENEARAQRLAAIVDASDDAILSRAADGTILSWNPGAERMFGYTEAEVIGTRIDVLSPDATPSQWEMRERVNEGERGLSIETRMRRKDGSDVDVSTAVAPILDGAGHVAGISVVMRDIGERLRLEDQLRQAQKLEAIGSLAGGIAHDFNNILTVIRAAADAMRRELADEAANRRLAQIDLAAEHAATLTRQLLAFSRQQILQPEPTDLNTVVDTTLELVERLIGEDVQLDRRFSSDIPTIDIDRGQLQQVILNLCVNARDAMPDGGLLSIGTSAVELDGHYAAEHTEVSPGIHVLLEITDDGVGMDAETVDRIFDPFYTTKAEGTGLGLATVYGIVKQSGGHIWVYSEPGVGTTFKIYLPAADAFAISDRPAAPSAESLGGNETILLVEDAEMLRPLVIELLEGYGYTVLAAADGLEALAVAERYAGGIDLLLTDVVMPNMNGRELSEALGPQHPEMKILFTSGYPSDTIIRHGISDARIEFIQKPYLGDELLAKIRSTLAS
jgi:two-component system, cell cycle sensor histidine kinase and response regulator CckA